MDKSTINSRQIMIQRLRAFLQESINLEPELEHFVKTLIFSLEYSEPGQTSALFHSKGGPSTVRH